MNWIIIFGWNWIAGLSINLTTDLDKLEKVCQVSFKVLFYFYIYIRLIMFVFMFKKFKKVVRLNIIKHRNFGTFL